MYLKTLELNGFKSFADKTVLEFHPGVTGIVGPNGCGKSNVVDAVRWVLGETSAKALRGSEMADVIFSGTDRRKPLGMAEVTLTFADCEEALKVEFNEVSVGRRVFRDGRSDYLINGKSCRLKDIQNLFMDTGIGRTSYSIMAQGQIDMLLSSKPEDRRTVFEEAAGITKFKKQKKETLRKLEYTEANLLRLTDILAEVKRQMNSLQRQAAKARRYQTLLEDVRVLDTHWGFRQFEELRAQKDESDTNIASLRRQQSTLEEQLANAESALETARRQLAEIDHALGETRHALNERRNRAENARTRISANEERDSEWREAIAANDKDIEQTTGKLSQQQLDLQFTDESLDSVAARIESLRADLTRAAEELEGIRAERGKTASGIAAARNEANGAETHLASLQARLESLRNQRRTDEERQGALAAEIARQEETGKTRREALDQARQEAAKVSEELKKCREAVDEADTTQRNTSAALATAREVLAKQRRHHDEKDARLGVVRALIESGEGLEGGTQAMLKEGEAKGVLGLMASRLEVPDEFVGAVEAALGSHLEALLVTNTDTALQLVADLRSRKLGAASFAAPDLLPASAGGQMLTIPEGALGWALDKIKPAPEAAPFFERALRDVLIVADLETARRLRPSLPDVTFATTSGELLTPGGIVSGGRATGTGTSILERRNEARTLAKALKTLAATIETGATRVSDLDAELKKWAAELEKQRAALQRAALEKSSIDGQITLLERELEQLDSRLEQLGWERGKLDERIAKAGDDATTMEAGIEETRARLESARASLQNAESALEDLATRENAAAARHAEIKTNLAVEERSKSALEAQRQPMEERLTELNALIARRRTEIDTLRSRITSTGEENENLKAAITQAEKQIIEFEAKGQSLAEERSERAETVATGESRLTTLRREAHQVGEQIGREEVQATQIELRLENLCETIRERHGIELASFEQDIHALKLAIESQRKARSRRRSADPTESSENEAAPADDDTNADADAPAAEAAAEEDDSPEDALPAEDGPDWDFVKAVIGELRQRLEAMGPVNLDAIQEFEELEERHTFLKNQHEDLVTSKAELLDIIEHINKETRVRFIETFTQVRKNFASIFRTLFGERAQSDLVLVDEEDPLESGIEIIAKPPGKKLQSISLLSGGERSLTAVALLFSIYMVKPSPFCVLDELDAPLDETNIGRFLKVLDNFIEKSQFIIVTHSKRTMARADIMYGVTMEEFGVSKPVGMRLTDEAATQDDTPADQLTAAERTARRIDG